LRSHEPREISREAGELRRGLQGLS
jgi:hypothetical protein